MNERNVARIPAAGAAADGLDRTRRFRGCDWERLMM
jgi:hypothetical protein